MIHASTAEHRRSSRHHSRRETPRLEVEAILDSALVRGNLRLTLHDLGFGGFAVEGPIAFTPASRHAFRFVTATGAAVNLTAETIYCRESGIRDGMECLLSGFKYVLDSDEARRAVEVLLDAAIAPLSFS
jgi:hypothetical protein